MRTSVLVVSLLLAASARDVFAAGVAAQAGVPPAPLWALHFSASPDLAVALRGRLSGDGMEALAAILQNAAVSPQSLVATGVQGQLEAIREEVHLAALRALAPGEPRAEAVAARRRELLRLARVSPLLTDPVPGVRAELIAARRRLSENVERALVDVNWDGGKAVGSRSALLPHAPPPAPTIRADARLSAAIDGLVAAQLSPGGPGVAVAVVKDGVIVHQQGYGYADIENRTPLSPDMRFDLASVSKQFTAMAVMILAERGLISLEDAAGKHLREFARAVDPRAREIRVIDMLQMVEGFVDYTDAGADADYHRMTNADVAANTLAKRLRFSPRSEYSYSNSAYNLLGLLVERVSGRSLGAFLRENVFARLGMTRSVVLDHLGQAIEDRVKGYARREGGFVFARNDTEQLVGDGNLFSTVGDLALWDRALLGRPPVSGAMLDRAWTSGRLDSGAATGYGFGWDVEREGRVVSHTGSWTGTSTYNALHRDKGLAVVLLSNDENFDAARLGDKIAALWGRRPD